MHRFLLMFAFISVLMLGVGGYAIAQDATPTPTTTAEACASPAAMASPVVVDLEASPVAESCY